ncbi:Linear gramicidin synthase subunit B [Aquisphaera giovannonii]|uniref:Linear gramicidin synthase subunit B n=1 Tax=Aquisphaera giovannonii TaxID=406548 RepID=A0A5B9W289_9BACT|nr:non-ribosomal peptide synthetase [Aquisphaera giovannonii]QEH34736.1 Linear gramicidin synthase subunit B [Aquisphaera giovannonii]
MNAPVQAETRGLDREPAARPLEPLHRAFERQAARTPEAVALRAATGEVSYRELNDRANQLARRLKAMGVGPDVLVGVCLPRSAEMVVGLLAALKAGGAYVPLDPSYPADRLAYMLEDSAAAVLLTEDRLAGSLADFAGPTLFLDRDAPGLAEEIDADLPGDTRPGDLAYVIYTSGSTGRPKGVMITHGGLTNYLGWCVRAYAMAGGRGAPVHSSISFDLTVTALWGPLLAGGRVDLLDESLGLEQLRDAFREPRDDGVVKITPAHLKWLGDQLKPEEAAGRTRVFVIGGEQLTAAHVAFWHEHAPGTALVNEYGPTETVVGCCVYRIPAGPVESLPPVIPIGRPAAGARLYVLDAGMEPVPPGLAGELYIGGPGVARGYLKRPGLTAEKFVPDPFSAEPGARLYRTGDLARYRPDGQFEYLGRVDRQVKVRGYRIEPGEIESALALHELIREAAVVPREDAGGTTVLAAYVVPRGDMAGLPPAAELRAWLAGRLPEYMVPATFTAIEALPLTPNGKLDPGALPEPGEAAPAPGLASRPASGPVEEGVAALAAELLGTGPLGASDNFFDRGGHSLLAAQLLGRLRQTFGVEVPLRAFVDDATVAGLARRIEAALAGGARVDEPPIERLPRDGSPLPASFAQQRLWYLDQLSPGDVSYNIHLAVRLEGELDADALSRAIAEIVRRHETLRTTFVAIEGVPHQRIAEAGTSPAIEFESLDGAGEAALRERLRELGRQPFDLANGPLFHARLLRLGEGDHALSLVLHHVVSDGWSTGVLIREATALYEAFRRGEPSPLPELPVQYADFASWQRRALSGDALNSHLAFWRDRLAGCVPPEIPADRPESAQAQGLAGEARARVEPAALGTVKRLAREGGATLYMALLAALDALLARYTGSDDVAVGTPVAGRSRPEAEGLVGFFVNTLVVRSDLSGSPGFRRLLARVRRDALDAYAHQDLPFERLVGELHASGGGEFPFRVMLVLQNAPLPPLEAAGLRLSPIELPADVAKFDATLYAQEQAGGLELILEYRAERYEAATMERLLACYVTLLEGAAADPDRPIDAIPLLTPQERETMAGRWRGPDDDEDGGIFDLDALDEAELDALLAELDGEDAP